MHKTNCAVLQVHIHNSQQCFTAAYRGVSPYCTSCLSCATHFAFHVISLSQQCFTAAQESGALELVLAMTRADASGGDALMRLNAMELLPYVAATSAGARFLLVSSNCDAYTTLYSWTCSYYCKLSAEVRLCTHCTTVCRHCCKCTYSWCSLAGGQLL
jgi:hypothetical protein